MLFILTDSDLDVLRKDEHCLLSRRLLDNCSNLTSQLKCSAITDTGCHVMILEAGVTRAGDGLGTCGSGYVVQNVYAHADPSNYVIIYYFCGYYAEVLLIWNSVGMVTWQGEM